MTEDPNEELEEKIPYKNKRLYVLIADALHELAMCRVSGLRPDLDLYWCQYLKRCANQFPRLNVNSASVDTNDADPDVIKITGKLNKSAGSTAEWVSYSLEITANLRRRFNLVIVCDDKGVAESLREMYEIRLRQKVQLD